MKTAKRKVEVKTVKRKVEVKTMKGKRCEMDSGLSQVSTLLQS